MILRNQMLIACCSLVLATLTSFLAPTTHLGEPLRHTKDHALFFAVSNYTAWDKLKNPILEAEAIAKELRDHYGFSTEVVKDPTKAQIQAKIEEYRRKTYAEDAQLLIFFTGHGDYLENTREGFFIPKDGRRDDESQDSYLSYLRLQRWIETLPCRHILLAIDACFSGTFSDNIALKGEPGKRPGQTDWRDQFIRNSLQYRSRLFMASGAKVRTPDQSAFANQFLAALRSFGGDDQLVNATELWGYIQRANPKPCIAPFGGGDSGHEPGGDFLFVLEQTPDPSTTTDPDLAAWTSTQRQHTLDAYAYYLEAYPAGRFRGQATEERTWLLALRQNTPAAYQIYLDTYPNGRHRSEAQSMAAPPTVMEDHQDRMALIPAGTFQMGSDDGEANEKPMHTVAVSSFYLSKYEVTVAEFRVFIEASAYRTDAEKEGSSYGYEGTEWKQITGRNWRHDPEGKLGQDNHPVINVSWNDAQAYIQWLGQKNGHTYRLPTEAEWEYAAGNGSRHTKYSWGNSDVAGRKGGNVADETGKKSFSDWTIFDGYTDGFVFTAPVGSFDPNDFGLFDITGNVWEWCSDWYNADYYKSSPSKNPAGASSGSARVFRGGSWYDYPQVCRVAFRNGLTPGDRGSFLGFRLARTK